MSQKRQKDLRAWNELRNRAHEVAHILQDLACASTQSVIADLCRYHSELLADAIVRVDRNDRPP
jgi:hypothetical protein